LSSLVLTLSETLRYRGSIGQWSWVLHRITGLGVLFFFVLHVVDTSWAVFYPGLYEEAIASYQSPLFTIGEFALVAAVVYHAYNGLRISIFDNRPELWKYQERAAWGVLGLSVITLIPAFLVMFQDVLEHYSSDPFILGLDRVLLGQLPFIVGMVVALIAALIISGAVGMVAGNRDNANSGQASGIERFWWSYMRVSGLLIVPLVFGHLAMMHILQGVFNLTASSYQVVGVPYGADAITSGLIGDGLNSTGTAVEFIGERWNYLVGGVAIWRIYDILLLGLVALHGFNGLRYVLTDYTSFNPTLKRAMVYLCVIGAVVLLVVGGAALLSTIDEGVIEMAVEASEHLRGAH
jgi:succinate dehydrogenase / fumarate reductase, cytochrome b subunit